MGNRSRYVLGATAVGATAVAARRRARLRAAATGIGEAIEPSIRPPTVRDHVIDRAEVLTLRDEVDRRRRPGLRRRGRHPFAPD